MKFPKPLVCALITLLWQLPCPFIFAQQVVINEFMSDNKSVIHDSENDYSDWIELYNNESFNVDLEGYSISDDAYALSAWVFPSVTIPANGFLLLFASNKDSILGGQLHTDFKINSSGEALYLRNGNGVLIDTFEPVELDEDRSFGRLTNGGNIRMHLEKATPGSSNANSRTIFCSHNSGAYSESINLSLTPANSQAEIRYTTNGNDPTSSDPIFSGPMTIYDESDRPNSNSLIPLTPLDGPVQLDNYIWNEPTSVYKANVFRYAIFHQGQIQGRVHSRTYFLDPNFQSRYTFPIISLVTDGMSLFDHDTGIMVPGARFEADGFDWIPIGNYHNEGIDWERISDISYFENNGDLKFQSAAGLRIRGYGSAAYPQKSLTAYFRSEYNASTIDYPIFQDQGAQKFKRLIFRSSGNDFLKTHFRDAVLQNILEPMELELQRSRPSVLFINGEYWGIYNIREKQDKFYFEHNLDIEEEDLIIVQPCGYPNHGDGSSYFDLDFFMQENDMSLQANYDSVSQLLDIENLINYEIAEIYYGNYDWPANNHRLWKTEGSKWRYLIYDLDLSFGFLDQSPFDYPSLEHSLSDSIGWPWHPCANRLFRILLNNQEFKDQFISTFAYHLNTTFSAVSVVEQINHFREIYTPEIEEHIERWGYPYSVQDWTSHIDDMVHFAENRPCYMKEHLMDFFNLQSLDVDCLTHIPTDSNGFSFFPNPVNGNRVNLKMDYVTAKSWSVDITSYNGKLVHKTVLNLGQTSLDVSMLENGLYIVTVISDNISLRQKLVVAR